MAAEGTAVSSGTDLDVLIVGAGLSGIGAAWYVQTMLPDATYAVLEAREAIGGTWDLFRYPGVRSDSDMNTLGFSFRPWPHDKSISEGETIRAYVADTARAFGIDRKIRFRSRVTEVAWDGATAHWTVTVNGGEADEQRLTCRFLYMCTGYYDYDAGHQPQWPGLERFGGRLVHPQHWPQDLDYAGKRVVIIGSGATAVTLAPAMAGTAAQVSVLQRSPTWVVSRPAEDRIALRLRRLLPASLAHTLVRWKNILFGMYVFDLARRKPKQVGEALTKMAREALGPDYDMRHFSPRYDPWDQRLCIVPDGDMFAAIREGRVEMVTDEIEAFDEAGVRLASGRRLDADVVVSATGLKISMMGKARMLIDGEPAKLGGRIGYKGMMFDGVPNFAYAFGYTNASWTLKCELISAYVCRLVREMDARGVDWVMPKAGPDVGAEDALGLTSGYVQRAAGELPKQGDRAPWRLHQNYLKDLMAIRYGRLDDGALRFGRRAGRRAA